MNKECLPIKLKGVRNAGIFAKPVRNDFSNSPLLLISLNKKYPDVNKKNHGMIEK